MSKDNFKNVKYLKIEREPDNKWRWHHTALMVIIISSVLTVLCGVVYLEGLINGNGF